MRAGMIGSRRHSRRPTTRSICRSSACGALSPISTAARRSIRSEGETRYSTSPGAYATTMRTGRKGYVCAQAVRAIMGIDNAPAAVARNFRRAIFMSPPAVCGLHRLAQQKSTSPRRDRRAALLVVDVDLHGAPHAIDMIGVTAHEGIHRGAILCVDNEDRADGRFAIISHERAGGRHVDVMVTGLVEMNAVVAVMLRTRRQQAGFVGGMDDEQHRGAPIGYQYSNRIFDGVRGTYSVNMRRLPFRTRCLASSPNQGCRMPRFAANLAYLFTEYPFMERFRADRAAGFSAVELQLPY